MEKTVLYNTLVNKDLGGEPIKEIRCKIVGQIHIYLGSQTPCTNHYSYTPSLRELGHSQYINNRASVKIAIIVGILRGELVEIIRLSRPAESFMDVENREKISPLRLSKWIHEEFYALINI